MKQLQCAWEFSDTWYEPIEMHCRNELKIIRLMSILDL